ncbi:MAG: lipocalin family protein, partial [Gammaproteobacteria bacterium]|nr:lipocalin family protein [Gammaproteobacteria bacterium]
KPLQRRFIVEASFDDQEMDLSVRYWEGAVVVNEAGARIGQGYLELTGY